MLIIVRGIPFKISKFGDYTLKRTYNSFIFLKVNPVSTKKV